MTDEHDNSQSINPNDNNGTGTIDASSERNPIESSAAATNRRRRDHVTAYRTANDAGTTDDKAGKRRRSASNVSQLDASSTAVSLRNSNESDTSGFLQSSYQSNAVATTGLPPTLYPQQGINTSEIPLNTSQNQSILLNANDVQSLPLAQNYISPVTSLMLANQLRQASNTASPFVQLSTAQTSTNEQQQLAMLLQQQLWGIGLAQSLGIQLQTVQGTAASTDGSVPNIGTSLLLSSSNGIAGLQANPTLFQGSNQTSDMTASMNLFGNNVLSRINQAPVTSAINALDSSNNNSVTGRPPIPLYLTCDDDSLSEYQCLVRKHIELFEAGVEDVESNAQGRNRPIVLGQVGIRCRHCIMLPPRHRSRGAIYYPAKLQGIYQAAQNLAVAHLGEHCQNVPDDVRSNLATLRERKSSAGGGKRYWADGVRVLGVYEDRDGLRFENRLNQIDGNT